MTTRAQVAERLSQNYGEPGRRAQARLQRWLAGEAPYAYPEVLARHLDDGHLALVFDAFWQVLPFGTGGRRGRVGYGPNRMNPTTVAMTVQGHCQYLASVFPNRSDLAVVVANDVRVFHDLAGVYGFLGNPHPLLGVSSRSLGKLACEIYAGNGIVAYFAEPENDLAVLTTPELSYLIGQLSAVGGINLSASHNPPDDNGIKVYDQYGSQPVAPDDQRLVDIMAQATDIHSIPFEEALSQDLIRPIPHRLHEAYIQTYVRLYNRLHTPLPAHPVVFTPLSGCGLLTVGALLDRLGFPVQTPPDQGPDGTFSAIPFRTPNPEVPQATEPAKAFADKHGIGLVLSSDPDADRVGLEARLPDGSWYHFDGNQLAAVLCYFLMLDPRGPQRRGLVIETLVTTRLLGRIVAQAGDSWIVDDLLVGFKYVAAVLKALDQTGTYGDVRCAPEQLVLAVEESHGGMLIPHIKDKDAAPACLYFATLYQQLRQEGKTLLDYYIHILEELGGYADVNRSIMLRGAEGVLRRDRLMRSLRDTPPRQLGGFAVTEMIDYWDETRFGAFVSETDKLPRNVLQVVTDGCVTIIRPSGTEPKLKFYCQLPPHAADTARSGNASPDRHETLDTFPLLCGRALLDTVRARAEAVAGQVYNDLLARLDCRLSEAGLLMSDIIDLDHKRTFDTTTVAQLRQAFLSGSLLSLDDTLAWLREKTAGMTPGADPLPALKAPLAALCEQWRTEGLSSPALEALRRWTQQTQSTQRT